MNWLAIVVAAASSFALGGLWYSNALFGATWNREAGRDAKAPDGRHPARVFGAAIAFALLSAVAYAWLVPPPRDVAHAALQGLGVGIGLVATSFGINYRFGGRSNTLLVIDGGYHALQFLLYGLVIGLWR